jgi:hypothetical protein
MTAKEKKHHKMMKFLDMIENIIDRIMAFYVLKIKQRGRFNMVTSHKDVL